MMLEPYIMSGEKSTSTQISTKPGILLAVDLLPPDAGIAILKLYDSNSGSVADKVIFEAAAAAGESSANHVLTAGRFVTKGIYAGLTDATATCRFNIGYSVI